MHFKVVYPLRQFREYADQIEGSFVQSLKPIADLAEQAEKEKDDYLLDAVAEDYHNYSNEFPLLLRSSLLVSLFSFLENRLMALCKEYEEDLKLEDIAHRGLTKVHVFLKKVAKVDFPDDTKEWHFIRQVNLIRNCIVHNGGNVEGSTNERKIRNAIANIDHVSIDELGNIILEREFCIKFIKVIASFLRKLYKSERHSQN